MLPSQVKAHLIGRTISQLESTWQWVIKVLDVAEGQLQRGRNFDVQVYMCRVQTLLLTGHRWDGFLECPE